MASGSSPAPAVSAATRSGGVVLIGNPNVGKSVLFGRLTGRYVTVSNYPGTTVEVTEGSIEIDGRRRTVIDTPGINNLIPASEDEQVTRDILLAGEAGLVAQVADAKNLRRALLLTLQLAEMGVPFVLALNMRDEAQDRGISIDEKRLSRQLGIPVVATVATRGEGLPDLHDSLMQARNSVFSVPYSDDIEEAVTEVAECLPESPLSRRSIALMILAGDDTLDEWIAREVTASDQARMRAARERLSSRVPEGIGYRINRERLAAADRLLAGVSLHDERNRTTVAQRLGSLSMHPFWGVPILLGILYAVFQFVGVFGATTLVGWLEETVFGGYINPWATRLVEAVVPFAVLRDFFVGEYGVITMALTYAFALILPIVTTFFLAFGALEDSGYLPRLAVLLDRLFKLMGLNGKAVLPMVLGLGCDTMATLTTRILESRKERLVVTLLLSLGVPCSAQLAIILAMLREMSGMATVIWLGIVTGVLFLVGTVASRVLPGDSTDFVLEVPPIRLPQMRNILVKTAARLEWYLKEAVPLFVIGTMILFFGNLTGLLGWTQEMAKPIVQTLLGLPPKAAEMFIIGFLRRDYGAVGFWEMQKAGQLDDTQVLVALVAITLFMPCIAQFFVTIKERGIRAALGIAAFVLSFSIGIAALLNFLLRSGGVTL